MARKSQALKRHVINPDTEKLIPIEEASEHFPEGAKPCRASVFNWADTGRGANGAAIGSILIGARRFVSKESIAYFIAAQNPDNVPPEVPTGMTRGQRRKQAENASRQLQAAGL